MAEKIRVIISDDQKEVKIPTGIRMLIRRCCHAVLLMEQITGNVEISVRFVDEDEIHRLNLQYRGIDKPTDVLSFPMRKEDGSFEMNPDTDSKIIGDIVICAPIAVKQGDEYAHGLRREVAFLSAHSMLHLLGYDHEQGGLEAVRMREKEETILTQLGLKRNGSYYMTEE